MTLARAQLRTTFFLAGMGFLSLVISGEMPLYMTLFSLATLILSYDYERWNFRPKLPQVMWNLLAFIFLLYEGSRAIFGRREFILNVAEFLVIIQCILLWTRKDNRQVQQIFGVSLLHLIAAAVLTADLIFAFVYVAYIVAGTSALVVFNLQRQLQASQNLQTSRASAGYDRASDILTPRFFAVLAGISVLVFICSILLFMCFPRLNYNYLSGLGSQTTPLSGFSDQIRLGEIGKIKLSDKPVMHVTLSGDAADKIKPEDFYFRGMILNYYDGKRWTYVPAGHRATLSTQSGVLIGLQRGPHKDYNLVQEIVAEPSDNHVLFGLNRPVAFLGPTGTLAHVDLDNLTGIFSESRRLKYTIYSDWRSSEEVFKDTSRSAETAQESRGQDEKMLNSSFRWFLQVPRTLDPRIGVFARELVKDAPGAAKQAATLSRYLTTQLKYTLNMTDPGDADPLAHFLFTEKAGHCEYFASSLAIMLRTLGIPSRVVSGYYFGEWNEVGHFYLIRERHAHTWVEALLPSGEGKMTWVPFDPTPSDPSFARGVSLLDRWSQAVDSLKLLWLNWVVDYDFNKQASTAVKAYKKSKSLKKDFNLNLDFFGKLLKHEARLSDEQEVWLKRGLGVIVLFILLGALRYTIKHGWKIGAKKEITRIAFYEKLQRLLRKKGLERDPSVTPWEYFEQASHQFGPKIGKPAVDTLRELTDLFCRLRYGHMRWSESIDKQTQKLLQDFKQALKQG